VRDLKNVVIPAKRCLDKGKEHRSFKMTGEREKGHYGGQEKKKGLWTPLKVGGI